MRRNISLLNAILFWNGYIVGRQTAARIEWTGTMCNRFVQVHVDIRREFESRLRAEGSVPEVAHGRELRRVQHDVGRIILSSRWFMAELTCEHAEINRGINSFLWEVSIVSVAATATTRRLSLGIFRVRALRGREANIFVSRDGGCYVQLASADIIHKFLPYRLHSVRAFSSLRRKKELR